MLTSDMAFTEQHRTVEMTTNDTKMGSNCESDRDNRKCNSKILTATWLSPQYAKRQVSKLRLLSWEHALKIYTTCQWVQRTSTLNLVHLKGPEDYCLPLGHQRLGMPTDDRIG